MEDGGELKLICKVVVLPSSSRNIKLDTNTYIKHFPFAFLTESFIHLFQSIITNISLLWYKDTLS